MGKLFNNGSTYNGTFTHYNIPPQTRTITTFLPSANSFIDAQKASNNVECDWKIIVLDGTENWTAYAGAGGNQVNYSLPNCKAGTTRADSLVTHLEYSDASIGNLPNGCYKIAPTASNIMVRLDGKTTDVATWKAYLAEQLAKGDPVILWYPLATPEVTTVTLSELTQPIGTVTILNEFADGTKGAVDFYGVNIQVNTPVPKPDEPYPLLSNVGEVGYGQYGKNLFDIATSRVAAVGVLQSDGSYKVDRAGVIGIWSPGYKVLFNGKEGTQYTLSAYIKSDSTVTKNITLGFYYSDGSIKQGTPRGSFTEYTKVTCTSDISKTVVGFGVYYDSTENIYIKDCQIEEGPTATPYAPYTEGWHGSGQQTVKMESVNLLSPSNIHQGTIVAATGKVSGATNRCYFDFIHVHSGETIWISCKSDSIPINSQGFIYSGANEDTFITSVSLTAFSFAGYVGKKYTASTDCYFRGLFLQSGNFTPADIVDAQAVIQGAAPTSYSPYVTPQTRTTSEILPSATSKLNMQGGNDNKDCDWTFVQFDGSENWVYSESSGKKRVYTTALVAYNSPGLCTHFALQSTTTYPDVGKFVFAAQSTIFGVGDDITSANDFKAWLAANKPIIAYKLATSVKSTVQTTPFDIPKKTTYVLSSQAVDGQALDVQAMCVSE